MKDYLKNKNELISKALLLLSVLMALGIVGKAGAFIMESSRTGTLVKKAMSQCAKDPNDMEQYFSKSREMVSDFMKKNLFMPQPQKSNPVSGVSGILGNTALINGKWCKAGDKVGDAEVVAVEATFVKVMWDGKEKIYTPLNSAESSSTTSAESGQPRSDRDRMGFGRRGSRGDRGDRGDRGSRFRRDRESGERSQMSEEARQRYMSRRREARDRGSERRRELREQSSR